MQDLHEEDPAFTLPFSNFPDVPDHESEVSERCIINIMR
jgi:hypothetical protein